MRCSIQKESFLTLKVGTLSKGAIFTLNMILCPERYMADAAVFLITYHYFILITVLCVISQGLHISLIALFFSLVSSFQSKFGLSRALSLFGVTVYWSAELCSLYILSSITLEINTGICLLSELLANFTVI